MFDEKCFSCKQKLQSPVKKCQNCIPLLESTYSEMQRIYLEYYEYQSSTSSRWIDD